MRGEPGPGGAGRPPWRRLAAPALRLARRLRGAPPPAAVVHTMGKVGSSAVARALRQAGIVTHGIHTLDHDYLLRMTREAVAQDRLPLRHVSTAMALRGSILAAPGRFRFVTLVRDPLARTLAAFFENLGRRTDGLSAASDPRLLWDTYLAETNQIWALSWFDNEFRDQLGIDVMAAPFDPALRFAHLEAQNTVVFRADCPDAVKSRVLSRAFGRRVRVHRRNIGAAKPYAGAYAAVQAMAVFPRWRAEEVYGSAFVRHFWTGAERARMLARWTGEA